MESRRGGLTAEARRRLGALAGGEVGALGTANADKASAEHHI
jgi:hypothetical protein